MPVESCNEELFEIDESVGPNALRIARDMTNIENGTMTLRQTSNNHDPIRMKQSCQLVECGLSIPWIDLGPRDGKANAEAGRRCCRCKAM